MIEFRQIDDADPVLVHSPIFLTVLNVEAEDGITGRDNRRTLYEEPGTAQTVSLKRL